MNLDKLLEIQKKLVDCIVTENNLEDKDLVADTFLALQVELAEFANEGRWFKYWSNDQKPRTCEINHDGETATEYYKNPLLEEYVDGLHLFMQIAILKNWEDTLYIYEQQLDPDEFDGNLTEWQLEMLYFINKSYFEKPSEEQSEKWKKAFGFPESQYHFRTAWILFLNIGINGFKFTTEEIEQAYLDKNKINHERQENGY